MRLICRDPIHWEPRDPKLFCEDVNFTLFFFFLPKCFTVAGALKVLVLTPCEVVHKVKGVNNVFLNQFGITGATNESDHTRHCFSVKLQKCFVEYETKPDFPST